MKFFLRLLILVLPLQSLEAQYVTIPDANFRNYLINKYPNCFNTNQQMDTTCGSIVGELDLKVPNLNIADLTGVTYFDSITYLDCSYNQLTSLPALPTVFLTTFVCSFNQLTSLPKLPHLLVSMSCTGNLLSKLPALPLSLAYLDCGQNNLSSLPTLPASLIELYCYYNSLTYLPTLPDSLTTLRCSSNQINSLPTLPANMVHLLCDFNNLKSLPVPLPDSLTYLDCNNNELTTLPVLPIWLTSLYCQDNSITCLPKLDSSLSTLYAMGNQIACIPNLPIGLTPYGMDSTYQVCDSSNDVHGCLEKVVTTPATILPDLLLYPNPSTGIVNIISRYTMADIRLIDVHGRVIFTQDNVNISSAQFDISQFAQGMYLVQIISGGNVITKKLIIE